MNSILHQIKQRRLELDLKQNDMLLRVGVSRQQYQRLESKGNPRLDTLELIAKGLDSELMLIPKEKLNAVIEVLEQDSYEQDGYEQDGYEQDGYEQDGYEQDGYQPDKEHARRANKLESPEKKQRLSDDPWQDLLGDES